MVDTEIERRLTALETQYIGVLDWIEEQKEMQKRHEDQELITARENRKRNLTLLGFGVTIVIGLLAIYFK